MQRVMPPSLRSSSTRSAPASAINSPAHAARASGNGGGPAGQIKQVGHEPRRLAPPSGTAGSQITDRLLHGSQRDDSAVVILARLGHGEDTMGAYIATAGIAGRVDGSGAIRGLRRAGVQTGINRTVSMDPWRRTGHHEHASDG
jgi:hypothetical protein